MEKEEANDVTPERVVQILKKKGTDLEEAKTILEFVKKIAHIAVNQYLRGKYSFLRFVHRIFSYTKEFFRALIAQV
ncbi:MULTISPECIES: hypothetical protein [Sphingobacterium]|uniref:Uncharacterized protein n=1 Tax=Sphingobacterium multivorum TaxID=28454 RepID=A0A2X2JKZ0_SPHMU|nr:MULTISPECIES: hypothetical protein [Sphingobacterium]QQT47805.1 hypothetical protein I6J00_09800 [Sphingobacterium multivorum]QQT64663.1 hypothetical protein I6I97_15010 [Sphingobacterium multivorum]QRQ64111.1 hypothetical protein I6J33_05200 [Sphingobacterium multivorum]SPZ92671.1 Uncharacterised protein [Sphingobacterium multivorum]SUJ88759.1 Uncharacterised protein [Sphingobacterium multivorum]